MGLSSSRLLAFGSWAPLEGLFKTVAAAVAEVASVLSWFFKVFAVVFVRSVRLMGAFAMFAHIASTSTVEPCVV